MIFQVDFWNSIEQALYRNMCPYLLKFVDLDLVVNVDVSLLVVNLRPHTGTLNLTIKTNNR